MKEQAKSVWPSSHFESVTKKIVMRVVQSQNNEKGESMGEAWVKEEFYYPSQNINYLVTMQTASDAAAGLGCCKLGPGL
jgi:hypothetical protein